MAGLHGGGIACLVAGGYAGFDDVIAVGFDFGAGKVYSKAAVLYFGPNIDPVYRAATFAAARNQNVFTVGNVGNFAGNGYGAFRFADVQNIVAGYFIQADGRGVFRIDAITAFGMTGRTVLHIVDSGERGGYLTVVEQGFGVYRHIEDTAVYRTAVDRFADGQYDFVVLAGIVDRAGQHGGFGLRLD